MTDECVRDMAAQAKTKAMTIFLNHRYNVPEDVFGVTTDSAVTSRAADGDGKAIWDMDLDINLAGTNPRVPKTWDLIKTDQVKLGVSIGAMIEDWEPKDEKLGFWGGLIIKKVNLLEASIVGIPANQRSWVANAVAAIKAYDRELRTAQAIPPARLSPGTGTPMVGLEVPLGQTAQLTVHPDGTSEAHIIEEKSMDADDTVTQPPLTPEAPKESPTPETPETPDESPAPKDPESDTPTATGNAEGDGSAAAESSGEPSSTEQPTETASAPEPQPAIRSAQEADLIEATVTSLEAAITEIKAKDATITSLNGQVAQLTKERDAATQLAEAASELIEKIATTPLGRKTVVQDSVNDFKSLVAKVYGPSIAATLETNP